MKVVPSNDMKSTVTHFYKSENDLWHKTIHKRGGTIEENVQSTLDTISPISKMHEVWENDELAAFFVTYHGDEIQGLEGFHIAKKYREKDFIQRFWAEIKSRFDGEIAMGLSTKNMAAVKHVIKQGFDIVDSDVNNGKLFVLLNCKNKNLCPYH